MFNYQIGGLLSSSEPVKSCFRHQVLGHDTFSSSTVSDGGLHQREGGYEAKAAKGGGCWDSAAVRCLPLDAPHPPRHPQFIFRDLEAKSRSIHMSSFQMYQRGPKSTGASADEGGPTASSSSPNPKLHRFRQATGPVPSAPSLSPLGSLRQTRLHKNNHHHQQHPQQLQESRFYLKSEEGGHFRHGGPVGVHPYMRLGCSGGRPSVNRHFFRTFSPRTLLPHLAGGDRTTWPHLPPPPPPPPPSHMDGMWINRLPPPQSYSGAIYSTRLNCDVPFYGKTDPKRGGSSPNSSRKPVFQRCAAGGEIKGTATFHQRSEYADYESLHTSAIASLSHLCSGLSSTDPSSPSPSSATKHFASLTAAAASQFETRSRRHLLHPHATPRSPPSLYRSFFSRGSLVQLADGTLKRVEDLDTDDFFRNLPPEDASVKMELSTVEEIRRTEGSGKATLSFRVGAKQTRVTFQVSQEHPFFVSSRGWSSCNPEATRASYGLDCRLLCVRDPCVSLTRTRRTSSSPAPPPPPTPQGMSANHLPDNLQHTTTTTLWQPHLTKTKEEEEGDDKDEDDEEGGGGGSGGGRSTVTVTVAAAAAHGDGDSNEPEVEINVDKNEYDDDDDDDDDDEDEGGDDDDDDIDNKTVVVATTTPTAATTASSSESVVKTRECNN